MMLFVSHAKGGTTGLLWHAIGTNGRLTGARSTSSKINGSQGDQDLELDGSVVYPEHLITSLIDRDVAQCTYVQCLAQFPDFGLVIDKDTTSGDQGSRRKKTKQKLYQRSRGKKTQQKPTKDSEEKRGSRSRPRIQNKEEAEAAQTSPSELLKMPRGTEGKASESQLENFPVAMVEQMRIQHEEMKTLLTTLAPMQRTTVQDVSKDQYDQLSKDVQMFVSDEEVGHTFAY
ncbi:hypothetical protein RB195_024019 [Necator americanus]|uniref:Uncharacterized protein n=1 Tax=Necator americanus TaxID=51031 RepID=A0ABR1ELI3_NECAM